MSLEELYGMREQVRREVLASTSSSGDHELDTRLHEATMNEVAKGWLIGPLSAEQLTKLGVWIPSRRFPVIQGQKLRPVDDYTVSGINQTVTCYETISPDDVDAIVAAARLHADALVADPMGRPSSSPFSGTTRHPELAGAVLGGRMYDVASAYKQLAVRPSQHHLAVVCVYNPATGEKELFQQPALPFGASAAVLWFNWVSHCLNLVFSRLFKLGVTSFYDDFTLLEISTLQSSASQTLEAVLEMLGWPLKELPGWSTEPLPLGARLDLGRASAGEIVVGNRPKRTEELVAAIAEVVGGAPCTRKQLEKLRGRILYGRSLCFGRFAALALKQLNVAVVTAPSRAGGQPASRDLASALRVLAAALQGTPPRTIRVHHHRPFVLFSDGAFEGSPGSYVATLGAVLLDPLAREVLYFGAELGQEAIDFLTAGCKQPICTIELLAVLASLILWRRRIEGQGLLSFIDNDPARHNLVRGGGTDETTCAVVSCTCDIEIASAARVFYDRVPSLSNVADAPSRGAAPVCLAGWPRPACVQLAPVIAGLRDARLHATVLSCVTGIRDLAFAA